MPARKPLLSPRRSNVVAIVPPEELGEPLDAEQIRARFFQNRVSRAWILDHVAPNKKLYHGRVAVWYEGDVRAWVPAFTAEQQARAQRRRRRRDDKTGP